MDYIDSYYRGRLQALTVVDDIVEDVVNTLRAAGKLDNTYIFFTCAAPSLICFRFILS